MSIPPYALFCLMVLVSLLISLERMGTALDEADIGSFCVWTCVAGTIAGLPILL